MGMGEMYVDAVVMNKIQIHGEFEFVSIFTGSYFQSIDNKNRLHYIKFKKLLVVRRRVLAR